MLGKGVLPEGLAVLHWDISNMDGSLQAGVLPDGLQLLRLTLEDEDSFEPGSIPSGLKRIGLPLEMKGLEAKMREEGRLPAAVKVEWMD
jgi:hypothetical protein